MCGVLLPGAVVGTGPGCGLALLPPLRCSPPPPFSPCVHRPEAGLASPPKLSSGRSHLGTYHGIATCVKTRWMGSSTTRASSTRPSARSSTASTSSATSSSSRACAGPPLHCRAHCAAHPDASRPTPPPTDTTDTFLPYPRTPRSACTTRMSRRSALSPRPPPPPQPPRRGGPAHRPPLAASHRPRPSSPVEPLIKGPFLRTLSPRQQHRALLPNRPAPPCVAPTLGRRCRR